MDTYKKKLKALEEWFSNHTKVLIAFSGGVDSALVAFLARRFLGKRQAIAVISNSSSLKRKDLNDAHHFCQTYDIQLIETDAREIDDPNYRKNPNDRCYFCKTALYARLHELIRKRYPGFMIINGNNSSDFRDYRPGLEAASEQRVLSPLAECQCEKEEIRQISRNFNLFTWNKPASPCLSSRFPYGEIISVARLRQVEEAENLLNNYGFHEVRVRFYHNEARLEVPKKEVPHLKKLFLEISPLIRQLGFDTCTIDEEGLISGKLNRAIKYDARIQH